MPASSSPREAYNRAMSRLEDSMGDTVSEEDAHAIKTFVKAHDEQSLTVSDDSVDSRAARTLKRYTTSLRVIARRLDHYDTTLLNADSTTINQLMEDCRSGTHPDVKDEGMTINSVSNKQGTVRRFMRYTDDTRADADHIGMYDREDTKVDERDVLSNEEIEACRGAVSYPRNRALFELMLYTGQRVRAVQSLRIRDLDFNAGATGQFWLNEEAAGLKGADGKRPMLGAKEALRDYVRNFHPKPTDDAAVFTCHPDYNPDEQYGDEIHHTSIWKAIKKIGKNAGVPRLHPHLLRHTAVTIMHRDQNLDAKEIKWIIGHDEDSTVMENTYSHLTDGDHISEIEVGMNYREPKEDNAMVPPSCPTCDAQLDDDDVACGRCGTVFTADAQSTRKEIGDSIYDGVKEADNELVEAALDQVRAELSENPEEVLKAVMDGRSSEDD